MLGWQIYLATRKKNDQLFNHYFMRPIAAACVALFAKTPVTPNQLTLLSVVLFAGGAALLIALPDTRGGWIAAGVIELSYLFDCCDGMLARYRKVASKQGHLFDFFTDEIKAVMLVGGMAVRLWRSGGVGLDGGAWSAGHAGFLLAGIAGVAVIASATSLTNFVRRPEISGRETPIHAHYETVEAEPSDALAKRLAGLVMTFLRFLNHYPSHIWLFAAFGRFDLFLWMYVGLNLMYLAKGWAGLALRFGRS